VFETTIPECWIPSIFGPRLLLLLLATSLGHLLKIISKAQDFLKSLLPSSRTSSSSLRQDEVSIWEWDELFRDNRWISTCPALLALSTDKALCSSNSYKKARMGWSHGNRGFGKSSNWLNRVSKVTEYLRRLVLQHNLPHYDDKLYHCKA
jgi:hypothetical protein